MGQVLLECPASFGNGLSCKILAELLAREAQALHIITVATAQASVQSLKVRVSTSDEARGFVKYPRLDHLDSVYLTRDDFEATLISYGDPFIFKCLKSLHKHLTTYLELPSWTTLASVTSNTSLSGMLRVLRLRQLSCSWRVSIDEPFGDRPTGLVSATHSTAFLKTQQKGFAQECA